MASPEFKVCIRCKKKRKRQKFERSKGYCSKCRPLVTAEIANRCRRRRDGIAQDADIRMVQQVLLTYATILHGNVKFASSHRLDADGNRLWMCEKKEYIPKDGSAFIHWLLSPDCGNIVNVWQMGSWYRRMPWEKSKSLKTSVAEFSKPAPVT